MQVGLDDDPGAHREYKGASDIPFSCDTSDLTCRDGTIRVPSDPGFGVTIDQEFVRNAKPVKAGWLDEPGSAKRSRDATQRVPAGSVEPVLHQEEPVTGPPFVRGTGVVRFDCRRHTPRL
jgi:hypothetical protein